MNNQQIGQLVAADAQPNAGSDADCAQKRRFHSQNAGDMFFLHTQNIVQPQFFFSLLHQKAVGVEQKNDGKECHNHAAHSRKLSGYMSTVDLFQRRVTGKRQQTVKNHNCEGGRQQVGQIGLSVIGDGVARQPPVG